MVEILPYKNDTADLLNHDDLFSSKDWLMVIAKTYSFEFFLVKDKLSSSGIIFTLLNDLKGRRIVSLPFCDYIDTKHITAKYFTRLVTGLQTHFPDIPIILKTNFIEEELTGLNIRKAFYHIVETSNTTTVRQNYSPAFRRGVRKAQNSEIEIKIDTTSAGIKKFHTLYTSLRIKKFNSIPQPFSFFNNIFEVFVSNNKGFILNAVINNKVIASLFVLIHHQTLYYKFGTSDMNYLDFRPNNLLFDFLFQYAVDNGFKEVNLGLTGASESYKGLLRFKEAMGGIRHSINYYRINPKGYNSTQENNISVFLKNLTQLVVNSKSNDISEINDFAELIYPNFA